MRRRSLLSFHLSAFPMRFHYSLFPASELYSLQGQSSTKEACRGESKIAVCLWRDAQSVFFYKHCIKFSRTDKMYAFFSRIGAQIWNSIPYSIKLLKRSTFRKKIKELLLNFLRSEDDYVEVSCLIKLFNTLG